MCDEFQSQQYKSSWDERVNVWSTFISCFNLSKQLLSHQPLLYDSRNFYNTAKTQYRLHIFKSDPIYVSN